MQEIERAAGEAFRAIGMPEVADDDPPSIEVLAGYVGAGRAWVVDGAGDSDSADRPVAYLIADLVDGNVHIEQVSVHPRFARRGVGRLLIEHVAAHARGLGAPNLTLTTFAEVAWNAPYYLRCGFVILDEGELTPGLRVIREHEASAGLDRWPRVCMRRHLNE